MLSLIPSSACVLIRRNLLARIRRLSRIPKQTHFGSPQNSSIILLNFTIESENSCGSLGFQRNHSSSVRIRSRSSGFRSDHTMASSSDKPQSVYDFTVKDAKGNDVDLSVYKGKVLIIVNVASQCGLTNSNYTELSKLYEKYKDQGLEILAFPCNQFGGQEPGTNEQIMEFACTRFKAEFPIFDKVDVNGDKTAPIYKFLKSSKGELLGDNIKWNFAKFLVDKDGKVVDRYAPTTSPLAMEKDIKKLLGIA
ncbi:Phospholipid-hydroperoxide glutathione peroxidase [Bertholletia excelsa]